MHKRLKINYSLILDLYKIYLSGLVVPLSNYMANLRHFTLFSLNSFKYQTGVMLKEFFPLDTPIIIILYYDI